MPKRRNLKNEPSDRAKADTSQRHATMVKNQTFAEEQTITNALSKQPHTQVEKQSNKETQCSNDTNIAECQPTMNVDDEMSADEKKINSVDDLERRLADSRRSADEMEEKFASLD